jgi:hypothetical protein
LHLRIQSRLLTSSLPYARRRVKSELRDKPKVTLKARAGRHDTFRPAAKSLNAASQIVIKASFWRSDVAVISVVIPYDGRCTGMLNAAQGVHQLDFEYVKHDCLLKQNSLSQPTYARTLAFGPRTP